MMAKENSRSSHELFERHVSNPILSVDEWPYGANSVFNATAARVDGTAVLLVRVEDFGGISHFTVARSADGIKHWPIDTSPTLLSGPRRHPGQLWGIEDLRIAWLEEPQRRAVCYTAYSKGGPPVALATTSDFKLFERIGPIMPTEDKDAGLFPVRFKGLWPMLHRPVPRSLIPGAHVWISFSLDLEHWGGHQEIIRVREGGWRDADKIGPCAPPLETKEGWLILYHGVRTTVSGSIDRLGLALLDHEDPTRLPYRTDEWIFGPKTRYEREGDVDDVVFPCGRTLENGTVHIYYGAADSCIAYATAKLDDLITYVKQFRCAG